MMKYVLTTFLLLAAWPICAQSNVTGLWKGVLTQNEGGYRAKYEFEVYLNQKGNQLTGRTYVSVDNIHATLDIVGDIIDGNTVRFRETHFVNFTELVNMEWCYKSAVLVLKRWGNTWRLEGTWEGVTSFGKCIPGKIYLTRQKPQA